MFRSPISLALAALLLPATALAQQPTVRTLEVPANASWQHAETSLILPSRLAGFQRVEIRDSTQDELDVSGTYRDGGTIATVFLFKTGLPDASIWFDRALFAVQNNPAIRLQPGAPRLAAFTPSGRTAGGLTAAFDLAGGGGAALAVVPAAPSFLLKIRITSSSQNGAQLAERIQQMLSGIRWPQWSEDQPPAAAAIAPCPQPLRTRRAREARAELADDLATAIMGTAGAMTLPEGTYCREPGPTPTWGVYRLNASTTSYVIALGDAGLAVAAGPPLDLSPGGARPGRTSLTMLQRDGIAVLPTFDRLPPPDQAVSVALSRRSSIRVQTR